MQINKVPALIMAFAIILAASPVVAQDKQEKQAKNLARVAQITARDGHAKALEEAITNYHHYMGDKKGAWHWQWYQVVTGPDTGAYIARSGNHSWEDFDAADAKKDWSEAAGAKFVKDVVPHMADVNSMITRTDDEVGMWPESMDGYRFFRLTRWYVRQGQYRAFMDGLKKIDGALKSGGFKGHYAFVHTVSGGHGNSILLVSPYHNYADMAPKQPDFMTVMNKAMGEEEAKAFLAEWSKTYKTGDNWMIEYRADLSDYGSSE